MLDQRCTLTSETHYHFTKFLNTGTVDDFIIIDEKTHVLLEGHEVYQALDLLSATKAPVPKVDIKRVEIKSLQPGLKPETGEAVTEAGLKGPKLPPKSFEVMTEPLKMDITLKGLLAPKEKDKRILKVYNSTLELLFEGWPTPLVKLNSLSNSKRPVWAKLEGHDPSNNSGKDRIRLVDDKGGFGQRGA